MFHSRANASSSASEWGLTVMVFLSTLLHYLRLKKKVGRQHTSIVALVDVAGMAYLVHVWMLAIVLRK